MNFLTKFSIFVLSNFSFLLEIVLELNEFDVLTSELLFVMLLLCKLIFGVKLLLFKSLLFEFEIVLTVFVLDFLASLLVELTDVDLF